MRIVLPANALQCISQTLVLFRNPSDRALAQFLKQAGIRDGETCGRILELGFDLRKLMKWLSSLAINYNQIITPNFVVQIIIWSSLTATLRRRTRLNRLVIVQSALL